MLIHSLLTDTSGHINWLISGDQTFVDTENVKQFHGTFELKNKELNHNASDQLLTTLVKTRTFIQRVQSKVSKQTKHVHLRNLEKALTIRKLITTAQT